MSDYETTHVLDDYYVGITALVVLPIQAIVLALAYWRGQSTILVTGTAVNLCVSICLTWALGMGGTLETRNIVLYACLLIHCVHLFIFSLVRFYKLRAARREFLPAGASTKRLSILPAPSALSALLFIFLPFAALLPFSIGNSPKALNLPDGGTRLEIGKASDIIGLILLFFSWVLEVTALWTLYTSELNSIKAGGVDSDGAPLALRPSRLSATESAAHSEAAPKTWTVPKRGVISRLPSPYVLLAFSTPLLALALWIVSATPAFYAFPLPKSRWAQGLHRDGVAALLGSVVGWVVTAAAAAVWARGRRV